MQIGRRGEEEGGLRALVGRGLHARRDAAFETATLHPPRRSCSEDVTRTDKYFVNIREFRAARTARRISELRGPSRFGKRIESAHVEFAARRRLL